VLNYYQLGWAIDLEEPIMRSILTSRTRFKEFDNEQFSRLILGILFCIILTTESKAQGFGISKIESSLYYKRPPKIYLITPTIFAQFYSKASFDPNLPGRMRDLLATIVRAKSPRLKLVSNNAETVITGTITAVDSSSNWETLTRSEYREIGSHTVHNDQTNTDETVTDYGYVNVSYNALVVYGQLSFEYEIRDVKSGLVLDSDKQTLYYKKDFEEGRGAPDAKEVYQSLAERTVGYISERFVSGKEWVKVLLPKGKLKSASELFKQGLLDQSLDVLNATPVFKSSKDDAYRLYSLGVADEAKAFTFDDPVLTKQYLEQAISRYKQATQLKPKEDNFWGPLHRAEISLYEYQRLIDHMRRIEERKKRLLEDPAIARTDQTTQPDLPQDKSGPPSFIIITNDTIVDWVKNGVSEDYILASIKHSVANGFDLSPGARAKLIQAGVKNRIINAMQSSQVTGNRRISRRRLFTTLLSLWPYLTIIF